MYKYYSVAIWHDLNISAGLEWSQHINTYLTEAHIILLLISANFLASEYCYSIEMRKPIERHEMITLAHQDHPELSMVHLCKLHGISRSWYYEHSTHPEQMTQEIALRDQIEDIILEFPGYGYRCVTHELVRQGWMINHKRVLRVMQEESLLCHLKKKFVVTTTNSRHGFPVYPNELAGVTLSAPDQAWVADFTYIRLRSAFVYLACLLDAFSHRCVGWHLSREMTTLLCNSRDSQSRHTVVSSLSS